MEDSNAFSLSVRLNLWYEFSHFVRTIGAWCEWVRQPTFHQPSNWGYRCQRYQPHCCMQDRSHLFTHNPSIINAMAIALIDIMLWCNGVAPVDAFQLLLTPAPKILSAWAEDFNIQYKTLAYTVLLHLPFWSGLINFLISGEKSGNAKMNRHHEETNHCFEASGRYNSSTKAQWRGEARRAA